MSVGEQAGLEKDEKNVLQNMFKVETGIKSGDEILTVTSVLVSGPRR